MTRPFRFGVVAPLRTDLPTWRDRVCRIADSGYSTLLMPDVPQWQPAPGPTLALAAALANIRVGTWVYASPVRPPWITAWEAHSLSFEFRSRGLAATASWGIALTLYSRCAIFVGMAWEVVFTDEFEAWWLTLSDEQ